MNFERVKREEADTVLKLYRSLLGTPYCVWTEEYPSEKEVEFDLSRDALFCMRDDAGNIAGVISIDGAVSGGLPGGSMSGIPESGDCRETS